MTFAEGSPTRAILLDHFDDVAIVMELGSSAAVKGNVRGHGQGAGEPRDMLLSAPPGTERAVT